MSEKEVLGFEKKYAFEEKEKRSQGFNNRIIRYHSFSILGSKTKPAVFVEDLKEDYYVMIRFLDGRANYKVRQIRQEFYEKFIEKRLGLLK